MKGVDDSESLRFVFKAAVSCRCASGMKRHFNSAGKASWVRMLCIDLCVNY